ncbi:MAG: hypothetical protein ABIG66_03395 [Candidatus Kerfeldbacteria bacterium]
MFQEGIDPSQRREKEAHIPVKYADSIQELNGMLVRNEEAKQMPELSDPTTRQEMHDHAVDLVIENPDIGMEQLTDALKKTPSPTAQEITKQAESVGGKETVDAPEIDWKAIAAGLKAEAAKLDEAEVQAAGGYKEWADKKIDERYGNVGGVKGYIWELMRMSGAGFINSGWENGKIQVEKLKKLKEGTLTGKETAWGVVRMMGPFGIAAAKWFEGNPNERNMVEQMAISSKMAADVLSVVTVAGLEAKGGAQVMGSLAGELEKLPKDASLIEASSAMFRGLWPGEEVTADKVRQFGAMMNDPEKIASIVGKDNTQSIEVISQLAKLCSERPEQVVGTFGTLAGA